MVTRYVSGLCVAGLGLCGGGWLLVAAVAFGGQGGEAHRVNEATGAGLMLAACVTLVAWAVAWRRRMRKDGVLGDRFLLVPKREARRNRRKLAKDIRRTARQSKRAARQAKHETDQPDQPVQPGQLADDEFVDKPAYLGITVREPAPTGQALKRPALEGREPGARGVSDTGLSDIGLTGTEVTRDTRRAARKAQRAARRAKAGADRPDRPADNEFVDENPYVGITVLQHAPDGHVLSGREPGASGVDDTGLSDTGLSDAGSSATKLATAESTGPELGGIGYDGYQGGHDGASAVDQVDVLGELRTLRSLLAPLLAGTGSGAALEPPVPSETQQAVPPPLDRAERPERPEQPWLGAPPMAGDDEVLRVAESEEAWW